MFLILRKLLPTSLIGAMAEMTNILKPPESVRGITKLDKDLFQKTLNIAYLSLTDVKPALVLPLIRKYLLKLDNFKPVQHEDENTTIIFLNPQNVAAWSDFPPKTQSALKDVSVEESNLKSRDVTLKYDNFNAETVLKAVLPPDKEGLSSFTKIGHIVHVNLREHLLPYKELIGEVLFDKIPGCRSVVNKTNAIDNTYRNFQMEVLKGEDDMLTTVKENNCTFKFDFSAVYWNSRLCTEHVRIVERLKASDVLFDVFAGVGPFALPCAKKKCHVYANDLNPESFKWLEFNAKANKIDEKYFRAYNKDGRDFIKNDFKKKLPIHLKNKENVYVTMNLPAAAVEFLDCFVGLFEDDDLVDLTVSPVVLVYCFTKGEDYVSIAKDLVQRSFGFDVSERILEVFRVRTVSSMKEMMRVTVRLDRDILSGRVGNKRKLEEGSESGTEKRRVRGSDGEEQEEGQQRL
ncbi:tRNA (guanine(37)-N1)-methyltransferase [Anoplophora glabripennis]|nr:tRNA (guanine(37)-N1)-methyltransferase [Anoplophora glabripennis]